MSAPAVTDTQAGMSSTTPSRATPKSRRTCSSRTSSNASPLWLAMPAVTAKRPGSSARQSVFGNVRAVRLKAWDADFEASLAALRDAMGEDDFESAWAEGAALSTDEAIAYVQ